MRYFSFVRTHEEHVLDLQLLACRKKFRGRGIGRHLVKVNILFIVFQDHSRFIVVNESRLYWRI